MPVKRPISSLCCSREVQDRRVAVSMLLQRFTLTEEEVRELSFSRKRWPLPRVLTPHPFAEAAWPSQTAIITSAEIRAEYFDVLKHLRAIQRECKSLLLTEHHRLAYGLPRLRTSLTSLGAHDLDGLGSRSHTGQAGGDGGDRELPGDGVRTPVPLGAVGSAVAEPGRTRHVAVAPARARGAA